MAEEKSLQNKVFFYEENEDKTIKDNIIVEFIPPNYDDMDEFIPSKDQNLIMIQYSSLYGLYIELRYYKNRPSEREAVYFADIPEEVREIFNAGTKEKFEEMQTPSSKYKKYEINSI